MNLHNILQTLKETLGIQLFTVRTTKVTVGSLLFVMVAGVGTCVTRRSSRTRRSRRPSRWSRRHRDHPE